MLNSELVVGLTATSGCADATKVVSINKKVPTSLTIPIASFKAIKI